MRKKAWILCISCVMTILFRLSVHMTNVILLKINLAMYVLAIIVCLLSISDNRNWWNKSAEEIFLMAANHTIEMYITASSATDIYYLIRKHFWPLKRNWNAPFHWQLKKTGTICSSWRNCLERKAPGEGSVEEDQG